VVEVGGKGCKIKDKRIKQEEKQKGVEETELVTVLN
jgi:hypothetical protein